MILAAGLGTRLRPVTNHYAKPAVPFLNIPLLYYPLTLLKEAGVDSLVINTHHHPEQIESLARSIPGGGFSVALSHEPGAPLGSGGGIWKAKSHLQGACDFFVCNGDEVILPKQADIAKKAIELHRSNKALATILVMEHPLVGAQFGGVWADQNKTVKGFGKSGAAFGSDLKGYHYIGLLILNERIFEYLPEGESNILYDALTQAIARGERVQVMPSEFTWFETGNPKDFLHATGESLSLLISESGLDSDYLRRIGEKFWPKGTQLVSDEQSIRLNHPNAHLAPAASYKGFVVIGDGCRVEEGALVENAVLLPKAVARKKAETKNEILLTESMLEK